jgi:hypothetical protein
MFHPKKPQAPLVVLTSLFQTTNRQIFLDLVEKMRTRFLLAKLSQMVLG